MKNERTIPLDIPYSLGKNILDDCEIYYAEDKKSRQPCVIKFQRNMNQLSNEVNGAADNLRYEAEKLRRWKSCPNLVRILDQYFYCDPPFIILERLGKSLEEEIPHDGMDFESSLKVAFCLATALEAIHALGDSHFDIKPENILYDQQNNTWKLIDPCCPEVSTPEYCPRHIHVAERDIIAMGRTFLTAYLGHYESVLPEEYRDIIASDYPYGNEFVNLLDRMLGKGRLYKRYGRPHISKIRKTISKMIKAIEKGKGS